MRCKQYFHLADFHMNSLLLSDPYDKDSHFLSLSEYPKRLKQVYVLYFHCLNIRRGVVANLERPVGREQHIRFMRKWFRYFVCFVLFLKKNDKYSIAPKIWSQLYCHTYMKLRSPRVPIKLGINCLLKYTT